MQFVHAPAKQNVHGPNSQSENWINSPAAVVDPGFQKGRFHSNTET